MSDVQNTVIVITISLIIFSILYVFSDFSYKISDNTLTMHWRILRFVPFASRVIKIEDIQTVRIFKLKEDLLSGGHIFGNLLTKKGVIIVLKKRRFLLKKIFITPEDPESFIQQIKEKIH